MPDPLPSTDPVSPPPKSIRWWLQAVQVRFRFLIIVCVAALVVSQWQRVEQVWDRVVWRMTGSSGSAVAGGHEYFCPMDPGVLSAWPAICPICNMDLVPRAHTDAQILPEGVVARMQLSPYRLQLAGVRTTQVEPREMSCTLNYSGVTTSPLDAQDEPLSIDLTIPVSLRDADMLRLSTASRVTVREADSLAAAFEISDFKYQIKVNSPLPQLHLQLSGPHGIASGVAVQVAIDVLFADSSGTQMLAVPETAVIHRGDQHLVYVETMPGMYDGVSVTLGRRCGESYPVLAGLRAGQKVATAGAFLIDAETRLNPNAATGYFGASQAAESPMPTPADMTAVPSGGVQKKPPTTLNAEDRALVDAQKTCPVTDLPLDSMGGPLPVMVGERKVFICCAGCEKRLLDNPDEYLAKLAPAP